MLRMIPFDSLESLLAEGDIHMMFSFREAASTKNRYRELTRCPAVCICARSHPLASRSVLTVKDRGKGGGIATCRPRVYPPSLFALQSRAMGNRETSQVLFCDNLEVLLPLVMSGYAFAVTADIPHSRLPGPVLYSGAGDGAAVLWGGVHCGGLYPSGPAVPADPV